MTSINDVVMKWHVNLLLPLFFYDIFRLIDEISGSQNVELVTQYNQSSSNYLYNWWGYKTTANWSKLSSFSLDLNEAIKQSCVVSAASYNYFNIFAVQFI